MKRTIAAALAGFVSLFLVVLGIQFLGSMLYPLPEGLDAFDPAQRDALAAHMAAQPLLAWLFAFSSELLGAFAGGMVAARIAPSKAKQLITALAGLALMGSIANWVSFTHPMWFMVGQVLGYPMVAFLAWRLHHRLAPTPTTPS